MPGTPPTSPRYGFSRPADGDGASFSAQVNAIGDVLDANAAHLGKGEGHLPGDLIQSHATTRAGAVLCDGAAYVLSSHPEMSALASACPGLVSGGTLTVPDYRGRTMIGAGTGPGLSARTLGQIGGEENHGLTASENGAHGHAVTDPGHSHGIPYQGTSPGGGGGATPVLIAFKTGDIPSETAPTGISIQSSGSGTPHNNVQPYTVANIFIKL